MSARIIYPKRLSTLVKCCLMSAWPLHGGQGDLMKRTSQKGSRSSVVKEWPVMLLHNNRTEFEWWPPTSSGPLTNTHTQYKRGCTTRAVLANSTCLQVSCSLCMHIHIAPQQNPWRNAGCCCCSSWPSSCRWQERRRATRMTSVRCRASRATSQARASSHGPVPRAAAGKVSAAPAQAAASQRCGSPATASLAPSQEHPWPALRSWRHSTLPTMDWWAPSHPGLVSLTTFATWI
jgi:hypothetical protein